MPRIDRVASRTRRESATGFPAGVVRHKQYRRVRKEDARRAALPPPTLREVGAAVLTQLQQWASRVWRATARALGG
jgi:hypothetical protein